MRRMEEQRGRDSGERTTADADDDDGNGVTKEDLGARYTTTTTSSSTAPPTAAMSNCSWGRNGEQLTGTMETTRKTGDPAPTPTAASNCSQGGNGCNYQMKAQEMSMTSLEPFCIWLAFLSSHLIILSHGCLIIPSRGCLVVLFCCPVSWSPWYTLILDENHFLYFIPLSNEISSH